jgi:hypothetical protein
MNIKSFVATLFLFSILGSNLLVGQVNYCGTYVSLSQKNLETKFTITEGTSAQSLPQINRTLSISVFVVKDQLIAPPYAVEAKLPTTISSLNQYFAPIALSFKICGSVHYVDNFNFNFLNSTNAKDLSIQNYEPNTINLFLVSGLTDMNGYQVNGYTYMPGDTGKNCCIFIRKDSLTGPMLAHQLGHFFNLYHTDETAFGNELPDKSNCTTTGDRCCDTDASPDLSISGMVNSNCVYIGNAKTSNQLYSPSTKNMMALSQESCHCVFSRTQFLRMIYALNNFRTTLR